MDYRRVLSIILGGGKGTRLFPLTEQRSKPAIPFGGRYRLVDIPISNCINDGLRHIYVLTQFNSASLHNHINDSYSFDRFSGGFVEVLAAEPTPENETWYSGTADAVRKNFSHLHSHDPKHYLIISGDHLHRLRMKDILAHHEKVQAEMTIAVTPCTREEASHMGVLRVDKSGAIRDFLEKPAPDRDINFMKMSPEFMEEHQIPEEKEFLGSLGLFVFNRGTLEQCLDNDKTDLKSEVIPESIGRVNMHVHVYQDFWQDMGTIKSFYEANINLTTARPSVDLYDTDYPLFTRKFELPPAKLLNSDVSSSIFAEGAIINEATIKNSVIGMRSTIEPGSTLEGVIMMGADAYESDAQKRDNLYRHVPNTGIGTATHIQKTIIDKNARIGNNCRIGVDPIHRADGDYGSYLISNGIIVIRTGALIPNGTII